MQWEDGSNNGPSTFFWAMKIESGIRKCFQVRYPFKITLATLENDPDESSPGIVSLWFRAPMKDKLLLCTLGPNYPQQVLHLYFFACDIVSLYTTGKGTINLLGQASVERTSVSKLDQISNGSDQSVVSVNISDDDDSSDDSWHPDNADEIEDESESESTSEDESTGSRNMSVEMENGEPEIDDQKECKAPVSDEESEKEGKLKKVEKTDVKKKTKNAKRKAMSPEQTKSMMKKSKFNK